MQLLARPEAGAPPQSYGFQLLSFAVRKLKPGEAFDGDTGNRELALVLLGGSCSVASSRGEWKRIGRRPNVFSGMPYALYLPIDTRFTVTAHDDCDLALCYCRAEEPHAPALITPDDIEIEIRGAGNATRQINKIIRPEFAAHRLLVVEVYTPGGNWSSYPPHKHDLHDPPAEVDLEEIYYYRVNRPEGYAIQKVYTPDRQHRRDLDGPRRRDGAGPGRLPPGGGRPRVRRLLPQCAGRLGAVDGGLRRSGLRLGAQCMARERSARPAGDNGYGTLNPRRTRCRHDG